MAAAFLLNQRQLQQHLGLTKVPTAKFPSPLRLSGLRFTRESTPPSPPLTSTRAVADPRVQARLPWLSDTPTRIPGPLTCSMVPDLPAGPAWCSLQFDKVLIQLILLKQASFRSTYPYQSVWLTRAVPCCCLCERCSVEFAPLSVWLPPFSLSSHLTRSLVR